MLPTLGSRRLRAASLAAVSVMSLTLSACGGGGGGGTSFIPAPPLTPPSTPPASATVITAPARASTGAGPAAVFAVEGGPNFTTGPAPGTAFPVLQTTLALANGGIGADAALNALGGSATIDAGMLKVTIPDRFVIVARSGHDDLDWMRIGYWDNSAPIWDDYGEPTNRGVFIAGYQTPVGAMPATGSATYSGRAEGSLFFPLSGVGTGTLRSRDQEAYLAGTALFTADFGARTLSGALTNMTAVHRAEGGAAPLWSGAAPWNDVSFTSLISGNGFSGSASATSWPSGLASLGTGATGTVEGRFFGPSAQEAGAVWTLYDGIRAAMGTFSGKLGLPSTCGWQAEC